MCLVMISYSLLRSSHKSKNPPALPCCNCYQLHMAMYELVVSKYISNRQLPICRDYQYGQEDDGRCSVSHFYSSSAWLSPDTE